MSRWRERGSPAIITTQDKEELLCREVRAEVTLLKWDYLVIDARIVSFHQVSAGPLARVFDVMSSISK